MKSVDDAELKVGDTVFVDLDENLTVHQGGIVSLDEPHNRCMVNFGGVVGEHSIDPMCIWTSKIKLLALCLKLADRDLHRADAGRTYAENEYQKANATLHRLTREVVDAIQEEKKGQS